MAKYRIRIEALDPETDLNEVYRIGIECDGFCILTDNGDQSSVSIQEMSITDIADCIMGDAELRAAFAVAEGFEKARKIQEQAKSGKALKGFFESLARGAADEED